jgi:hypothetical protein
MLKELIAVKPTPEEIQKLLEEIALSRANKDRVTTRLAELFAEVEKNEKRVVKVIVGFEDSSIIRQYVDWDPVTKKEELAKGYFGNLWGAEIWLRKDFNKIDLIDEDGKIYNF